MLSVSRIKPSVVFVALILVAVITRLVGLDSHGIWVDERVSFLISHGLKYDELQALPNGFEPKDLYGNYNMAGVVKATIEDNGNSLLFNWVLYFQTKLFGSSDWSLRFPSVVFAVLTILLGAKFANRVFGKDAALVTLLLLIVSPMLLRYSQEARPYSMAMYFSLLATYCFWNLCFFEVTGKTKRIYFIVLYGLAVGVSLLSHYLSVYVFLAHIVISLIFVRKGQIWLHLFIAALIPLSLMSYWMLNGGMEGSKNMNAINDYYTNMLATDANLAYNNGIEPASIGNLIKCSFNYITLELGLKLQKLTQIRNFLWLIIVPLGAVFYLYKMNNRFIQKQVMAFCILGIMPVFFSLLLSLKNGHTISFNMPYSSFGVVPVTILIGGALAYLVKSGVPGLVKFLSLPYLAAIVLSMYLVYLDYPDFRLPNKTREMVTKVEALPLTSQDTLMTPGVPIAKMAGLYLRAESAVVIVVDTSLPTFKAVLKRNNNEQIPFSVSDLKRHPYNLNSDNLYK